MKTLTIGFSGVCMAAALGLPCGERLSAEPPAAPAARAGENGWKAGVARQVITPGEAIWMAGYGARTRPAEDKLQDLFAKALVLEDASGRRLVLITTDLIGLRAAFTDGIAWELQSRHCLTRDQLMFTSSHTHSGPLLASSLDSSVWYPIMPEQGGKIRRYTQRLREQLMVLVHDALADLKPARISWAVGQAGLAVNRREPTATGIVLGTHPDGPVDHDVPVLRVESPDGTLRAVAFGYACHNTTLDGYLWCGDYAGYAQEFLERTHPDMTALFFMGCGADANPQPRRSIDLCRKHGRALANAVETVLRGPMQTVSGQAESSYGLVELPLDRLPTREELDQQAGGPPSYTQRRAAMLLNMLNQKGSLAPHYSYPVQAWQLGPQLTWLALGGEVVVDYAHRLKRELGSGTWVAAYANDVMAYIPSLRVLREGGYEATITSGELAGACWGPEVEERIIRKVHELAGRVRSRPRARPGND